MYEEDESFEEAVHSFFQAFHPTKELKRASIPYDSVSKFLSKTLSHPLHCPTKYEHNSSTCGSPLPSPSFPTPSTATTPQLNGLSHCLSPKEEKPGRISRRFDFSHQFLFEATTASASTKRVTMSMAVNGDGPGSFGGKVPEGKVDRRRTHYKAQRLGQHQGSKGGNKGECVVFDCQESGLLSHFEHFLEESLSTLDSSLQIYHLALNSLAVFFAQNTWSTKCQENVLAFLRKFEVKNSGDLCRPNGVTSTRKQLETEVMCLLELFMATFTTDINLEELNVLEKLRLLRFVYGQQEVGKFVAEGIHPEFHHSLPHILASIHEQMKIPLISSKLHSRHLNHTRQDGEEEELISATSKAKSRIRKCKSPVLKKRRKIGQLKQDLIASVKEEEQLAVKEEEENGGTSSGATSSGNSSSHEASVPPGGAAKRRESRTRVSSSEEEGESQLPASLEAEELKEEEEEENASDSPPPQIKRNSRRISDIEKEKAKKLSQSLRKKIKLNTKRSITSSLRSATAKLSQIVGRGKRTALLLESKSRTKTKLTSIKLEKSTENSTPTPQQNASYSSNNSPFPSSSSKNAICALNDKVMAKYKERMDTIKSNARMHRLNSQEVFYGRTVDRQGLFDGDPEDEDSAQQSSASSYTVGSNSNRRNKHSTSSTRQKNRSGRAVKQQDEQVYIAHTLLNIHNPRPLHPFKVNSRTSNCPSTFKIRKFVKRASRSERKKMEKYKKSQQQQQQQQLLLLSSSTSVQK